ncbi:DNA-deoxyinosine glycosylase [Polymorphobacter multimanifer]|uniref:Hypoxanthine-DNA glycosylase n=1 Tax=Polymorphobacter multimanifer TaxID=1070431 RepID=A0A841LAM5_9SPHN|nr:DNA-deoxyinosine glycosylase [Polymorphobacter multimanifer]MBB6229186.1 hypoxanthine-DNA glycosylase [Polymorphobacter multimanifer]GGI69763.1 DNA-deoxyinosine glycosylase [Polymorphobacter multimanifer]
MQTDSSGRSTNPLPPLADANTRVLILGSLPGRASLAAARYYAHPRNQFWALLGPVVGADLVPLDHDARLDAIARAGIGLWDVIGAAARVGSLDSAIRAADLRDLAGLVQSLPALRLVAFNGGRAAKDGAPLLSGAGVPTLTLPSSSAALARPLAWKQVQWQALAAYL